MTNKIIDEYAYLDNIANWLNDPSIPIYDEYNLLSGRKTGKTTSISILCSHLWAVGLMNYAHHFNKKVAIYYIRYAHNKCIEVEQDLDRILFNDGWINGVRRGFQPTGSVSHYTKIHNQGKTIYRVNGTGQTSFIQVVGFHSSQKSLVPLKGLASVDGYDLCVVITDECNELSNSERLTVKMAVRGAKRTIFINSSNPDLITQDYVVYCHRLVPFNQHLLKTEFRQLGVVEDRVTKQTKLFHYANFRVNPHLSQDEINHLEELRVLNPLLADP